MSKRVAFTVYVNIDPIPGGAFDSVERARNDLAAILDQRIPQYKPVVSVGAAQPENYSEVAQKAREEFLMANNPPSYKDVDVVIQNRVEAWNFYKELHDILSKRRYVTQADINALLGMESTYIDHRFGWNNLQFLRIVTLENERGYSIFLPAPKNLSTLRFEEPITPGIEPEYIHTTANDRVVATHPQQNNTEGHISA